MIVLRRKENNIEGAYLLDNIPSNTLCDVSKVQSLTGDFALTMRPHIFRIFFFIRTIVKLKLHQTCCFHGFPEHVKHCSVS